MTQNAASKSPWPIIEAISLRHERLAKFPVSATRENDTLSLEPCFSTQHSSCLATERVPDVHMRHGVLDLHNQGDLFQSQLFAFNMSSYH
jgi:hypothetical protein